VHGGTQQLGIFGLKLQLPLFHFIQQAVEVLAKLVELFDTPSFTRREKLRLVRTSWTTSVMFCIAVTMP
jgi:hypothetical protein